MKNFAILLTAVTMITTANAQSEIRYEDAYSVYITKELRKTRDFYVTWLDFEVAFEASWFVYLQSKGDHKVSIAFIDEDHPSTPPSYGAFDGRGSFLTLQVANATEVCEKLKKMKAPITYALKKEDWGQIRFGMTDPNGLYVDVVQQVAPAEGYWEKYATHD